MMGNVETALSSTLLHFQNIDITPFKLLNSVGIFLVAYFFIKIVKTALTKNIPKDSLGTHSAITSVMQITTYVVYFVAILMILNEIGINVTLFIAGSTALLLGIGIGMQQMFQNIVSGITILIDGTVRVGDILEFNDQPAKAVKVGLRTSIFETREGVSIIVPNSKLVSENVFNVSYNRRPSMFYVQVGVSYNSDVKKVTEILNDCTKNDNRILGSPAPFVRFYDFGDSALIFQLFFTTAQFFEIENIKSDLRYKIRQAFKENEIQIPFPQRVVHLNK